MVIVGTLRPLLKLVGWRIYRTLLEGNFKEIDSYEMLGFIEAIDILRCDILEVKNGIRINW